MFCDRCSPLVRGICGQADECALGGGDIFASRNLAKEVVATRAITGKSVPFENPSSKLAEHIPSGLTSRDQKRKSAANNTFEAPGI